MSSALATLVVVHHRRLSLNNNNNNNNNPVIWVMRNNNNCRLSSGRKRKSKMGLVAACSSSSSSSNSSPPASESGGGGGESLKCVGTGLDVECLVVDDKELEAQVGEETNEKALLGMVDDDDDDVVRLVWDWVLLLSPFFFWGTSMVAMKEVLPKAGPFFVSAFRLIPAGLLLVSFASWKGRRMPCGFMAWLSITLFALLDSTCFQGFLAVGLQSTSAGLGSVIIDSQPLTVALLASLFFGESITLLPAAGLLLGLVGLLLLELPPATSTSTAIATALDHNFSLWESSGEWWMFLAAQSMAVGTVMVRWVSKYSDPIMATGWHMVIGGLPLFFISLLDHNPAAVVAVAGTNHLIWDLTSNDFLALLYTSIFGSAISYGVFFYNATTGSLTKLSSLTFLTPMFASIFGFIYLGETYSPVQVVGAMVTVLAIYMVNCGKGGRE